MKNHSQKLRVFKALILINGFLAVGMSGWCATIKVACVGDSITEGAGLGGLTYPARVRQLVGPQYEVRNYGLGGRTLLKKGDYPYWKENLYRQSLLWEPDIVIIKLGTNDSKPQNWRYGSEFVGDYEEFIASYRGLPSRPRVILATPCPVFNNGAFSISPTIVADEIAPTVRDMAARLELELIDYHERMAGLSTLFPDTVHPDSRGTTVMAALAYEVIAQAVPQPSQPALALRPGNPGRFVFEWPLDAGGYVLQESSDVASSRWLVTQMLTVNSGSLFRIDARQIGGRRFYRLWKP